MFNPYDIGGECLYTVKEVGDLLGLTEDHVRKIIRCGGLAGFRIGKRVWVKGSSIKAYMTENLEPVAAAAPAPPAKAVDVKRIAVLGAPDTPQGEGEDCGFPVDMDGKPDWGNMTLQEEAFCKSLSSQGVEDYITEHGKTSEDEDEGENEGPPMPGSRFSKWER